MTDRVTVDPALNAYLPLLTELGDLKRLRAAHLRESFATGLFRSSWEALVSGGDVLETALSRTSSALCAARLGAIDAPVLASGGLGPGEALGVLLSGFDAVADPIPEPLYGSLRSAVGEKPAGRETALIPGFVEALARQPRAGATRPGSPRLMLEPPESHAEHCAVVAVYGVTLSGAFGADPARVFVAGLGHHLHNAALPDSGFAGEQLLGEHLEAVCRRLRESALEELPELLRHTVGGSLELTANADSPEARAFHAADVLDRVLQMRHYERQAGFTLDQALEEMQLVHPGPLKDFQDGVLSRTGLP